MRYQELKDKVAKKGIADTTNELIASINAGERKPEDFSVRDLAELLVFDGREWVRSIDPRVKLSPADHIDMDPDLGCFSVVMERIIAMQILSAYERDDFVVSRLVSTVACPVRQVAHGFPEDPYNTKRGFVVPVTREAIFLDRTNMILNRASEVGEVLGLKKERRILDMVIGVTNNYEMDGTVHNTYQLTNDLSGNELTSGESVVAAWKLLPSQKMNKTALVMPAYRHAAHESTRLTNVEFTESSLAYRRIIASGVPADDAKKWWFLGDFEKAFSYEEEWPLTVTQEDIANDPDSVLRFKASARGRPVVIDPKICCSL